MDIEIYPGIQAKFILWLVVMSITGVLLIMASKASDRNNKE